MIERNTLQKKMIFEALKKSSGHPTAEDIYWLVSEKHNTISRATVYRNLNTLNDAGVIAKIECNDKPDRYDINPMPHYHAECSKCGKFIDIHLSYNKDEDKKAEEETGFKIINHTVLFRGLCPNCKNEK